MKNFYFALLLFSLTFLSANAQNDCADAILVCGNSNFSGLTADGYGVQELNFTNVCQSVENNSIWLKLIIKSTGSLSFTITPESTDILEDFDFYIFGPTATCANLGTAIRCSTTNPEASNAPNNLTGLNDIEVDTAEGPGQYGNNYVKSIPVLAGETYYLVVDRPIGTSNFSMQWTGTSTFNTPPIANHANDIKNCDIDGTFDQSTNFDLTQNTALIQGTQTDVVITYHLSQNDATLGINPIIPANNYINISNPQTIYARIINNISNCFDTTTFELKTTTPVSLANNEAAICDSNLDGDDTNGQATFNTSDLNAAFFTNQNLSNLSIKYYPTKNDAENNTAQFGLNFVNTTPFQQTIYILITDQNNCPYILSAIIKVKPLPASVNQSLSNCKLGTNASISSIFNLNEADLLYLNGNLNLQVSYYASINDLNNNIPISGKFSNTTNPQIVFAKVLDTTTNCYRINDLSLNVNTNPGRIIVPLEKCDSLSLENGLNIFDLSSADLNLQIGESAKFYTLESDAVLGINEITTINQYPNPIPYLSSVFVRIDVANSCAGISELKLVINKLPNIETQSSSQFFICLNIPSKFINLTSGFLDNSITSDYKYKWFLDGIEIQNATNDVLAVNTAGIYTVEVSSVFGCSKTRTILVKPSNIAQLVATNVTDFVDFNSITVSVIGEGSNYQDTGVEFGSQGFDVVCGSCIQLTNQLIFG